MVLEAVVKVYDFNAVDGNFSPAVLRVATGGGGAGASHVSNSDNTSITQLPGLFLQTISCLHPTSLLYIHKSASPKAS